MLSKLCKTDENLALTLCMLQMMFDEPYGFNGDHKENTTVFWNWCIDTDVY